MAERDGERDERDQEMRRLAKEVAENKIRMLRILEAHGFNEAQGDNPDELDARLKRIEERRRGPAPN